MDVFAKLMAKMRILPYKYLITPLFWLGLIAVIYLLAQISWKLIPSNQTTLPWQPTPVSVGSDSTLVDVIALQNLALFGDAKSDSKPPKKVAVATQIIDAPKTNLSIQLTGVVASTKERRGLAVIAYEGRQSTYGVGDKIKGISAALKEVYADRIIISNGGRYETLMLDGLVYNQSQEQNNNRQLQRAKESSQIKKVDQRANKDVAIAIENSRDELLKNPNKIDDYLHISPVREKGQLQGYRLTPGKKKQLFREAGFKANDLVKSINGHDLTQTSQAMEVMAKLPRLNEISLVVERKGQLVELMFSLPQ